jgi:hypothetical protein
MSNSVGGNGSLLVGLTMLAVGGLGLFIYKSTNDSNDKEDDDEDDNVSLSSSEEEDEEPKPPAKKTRAKTMRPKRATKGTMRRY